MKRTYDSTVARIAGNIYSGFAVEMFQESRDVEQRAVVWVVQIARQIVQRTQETEPVEVKANAD